jgi:hypothetical protein
MFSGRGEERRQPQTDPRRAFLCLQALGLQKPVCTCEPASHVTGIYTMNAIMSKFSPTGIREVSSILRTGLLK